MDLLHGSDDVITYNNNVVPSAIDDSNIPIPQIKKITPDNTKNNIISSYFPRP